MKLVACIFRVCLSSGFSFMANMIAPKGGFTNHKILQTYIPLIFILSIVSIQSCNAAGQEFIKLECLDAQNISAVRSQPKSLLNVYRACEDELSARLELNFTEVEKKLVFSSIAAQSMAPYGSSQSFDLQSLLSDPELDCDNYVALTVHFAKIVVHDAINVQIVGFDGGAVGNHAQLFISTGDNRTLLLDPTVGLVAAMNFDELLQGKKPQYGLYIFRQHQDPSIDEFALRVSRAVHEGIYKPSDLLYLFYSIDEFVAFGSRSARLWKERDVSGIVQQYPTPASMALKKNLETVWGKGN